MASSPSAALRLELMATGDQSGTWGNTTNTNLGTLLEQAITGYLSVAQGDVANLTLTTTNYASDQARNAVINVTGALTATRNVVVQTANKLYTIINATTGGFSIVAKTSGGTGVSIPPGASMYVYSDGTNVVQAANYWNGQIGGAVYLDAGATVGPNFDLFRDSTSPAVSDILGRVTFNGRDSAGNKQEYGSVESVIADPTSTSEDSTLDMYVQVAGTRTLALSLSGPGSGTWTPVFTASGSTFSYAANGQIGRFVKNGKTVTAMFRIQLATTGNTLTASAIIISPLPFNAVTTTNYEVYAPIQWLSTTASYIGLNVKLASGNNAMSIQGYTAATTGSIVGVNANDLLHATNGTILYGTLTYEAA